ncbi:hypothetical protein BDF22DRAFT_684907 [Syncephalis plumigaleata]|nr:hypothetical protein BDF22DRAFT_684907 [Syncephalis plumigaleata]
MLRRFSAVAMAGVTLLATLISVASVTTAVNTNATTPDIVAYPLINCMDTSNGDQELVHFHRVEMQQWHDNATVSITGYGSANTSLPNATYANFKVGLLILPLATETINHTCSMAPGLCTGGNFTITKQYVMDKPIPLMELELSITIYTDKDKPLGCFAVKTETYNEAYLVFLRAIPPLIAAFLAISTIIAYGFATGRFSLYRLASGWRPHPAANDAHIGRDQEKSNAVLPMTTPNSDDGKHTASVLKKSDDTPASTTAMTRSSPGMVDVLFFCQAIAASGQVQVVYPLFYKTFTAIGFAWATLAVRVSFILNIIRKQYAPPVEVLDDTMLSPVDYTNGAISSLVVEDQLAWLKANELGLRQFAAYLGFLPHELFPASFAVVLVGIIVILIYTIIVFVVATIRRKRAGDTSRDYIVKVAYYGMGSWLRWIIISAPALITYGFFQFTLNDTGAMVVAAIGIVLLQLVPIGFLLYRLHFRLNAADVLHDPTRLLLYGPLINAFKANCASHAFYEALHRLIVYIVIGIGAVAPAGQAIILVILELIVFILLIIRRPYAARNDLQMLFAFTRLLSFAVGAICLLKNDLIRVPVTYIAIFLQFICLLICVIAAVRRILATGWRRGRRLVGLPEKTRPVSMARKSMLPSPNTTTASATRASVAVTPPPASAPVALNSEQPAVAAAVAAATSIRSAPVTMADKHDDIVVEATDTVAATDATAATDVADADNEQTEPCKDDLTITEVTPTANNVVEDSSTDEKVLDKEENNTEERCVIM